MSHIVLGSYISLVWPDDRELWFHSWHRGIVETLDANSLTSGGAMISFLVQRKGREKP